MTPAKPGAAGPAKGKPAIPPGIEAGDEVYVAHPERGPIAVTVLAHGRDGLTGQCGQGQQHRITWDRYLGHRRRMLHAWNVVDRGADGTVLQDDKGRRRFLAGELPTPEPAAAAATPPAEARDDPLLAGLDRLTKAEALVIPDAPILFLKAAGTPLANRAGLALRPVTDRSGRRTQRWMKTAADQPQARQDKPAEPDGDNPGGAPLRHGDVVQFRHGDVGGEGQIIGSGKDGVTVRDKAGQEHRVRHEHLVKPGDAAPAGGEKPTEQPTNQPTEAADNPQPLFPPEETDKLPPVAAQPVKEPEELYQHGAAALAHLKSWLDQGGGVCDNLGYETMTGGMESVDWSKPGGMLFIAPLKGRKRAAEKVEQDYGGDWSQLRDVVRCSIAVDSPDQLRGTLDALRKNGLDLAMRPKDRFAKPLPCGYRDLLMNVRFPNGTIGEVQLHLKGMLAAKEQGHKYYEIERSLIGKGENKLSAEDKAKIKECHDKMLAIYSGAWRSAQGGGEGGSGEGDEMSKAFNPEQAEWEYLDHGGAKFRRRSGNVSWAVDDVLHGQQWKPYQGDRLHVGMFGDIIDNPMTSGGGELRKALFLKAAIPGGAAGDLFAEPTRISGYTRDGHYVAPYTAERIKHHAAATAPEAAAPALPLAEKRATYPDGRLIPVAGDAVYQAVRGPFDMAAVLRGIVYRSRGPKGGLRVRLTGGGSLLFGAPAGKTYPMTEYWTVVDDPELARRKAARESAEAARASAEAAERASAEARVQQLAAERGTLDPETVNLGDVVEDPEGNLHLVATVLPANDRYPRSLFTTPLADPAEWEESPRGIGSDLRGWRARPDHQLPDDAALKIDDPARRNGWRQRIGGKWMPVDWDDDAERYVPVAGMAETAAPPPAPPGAEWEDRGVKGGVREHRMLAFDSGKPQFGGSAKRYYRVWEHPDGQIFGQHWGGYVRRFPSVADAKAHYEQDRRGWAAAKA